MYKKKIDDKTRIIATGGASNNNTILQILSDVFNAPVYTQVSASIFLYIFRLLFKFKHNFRKLLIPQSWVLHIKLNVDLFKVNVVIVSIHFNQW